ncbi:MAG TPA: hypothetical protein VN285_12500 [Candidatus Deferrimicrobium sp.]|nr:hypothetical protein [Candidatus Deferrimicrobium sp.]
MQKGAPLSKLVAVLIAAWLVAAANGEAGTYVSLKGNFYITYPDEWVQVDYRLVDMHLRLSGAGRAMLNYEAVFAPAGRDPFYSGSYCILTVDTVGEVSQQQIDSVLGELERTLGASVTFQTVENVLAESNPRTPAYDAQARTAVVLADITEQDQFIKKHVMMMKFFSRGIATFYFYSPESDFEAGKRVFANIVSSFSTENVDQIIPKEQLKVADLDEPVEPTQSPKRIYLYIGAALVLAVLVLLRLLKKS